jgi:hypothetical protein
MILVGLLQLGVVVALYPLGIYPMVIGYLIMYFIGLWIWQRRVYTLIGLKLKDILKDVLPYFMVMAGCFAIAWFLTRNIQNLYLLLTFKVSIVMVLYILTMKLSRSTIFEESIEYFKNLTKNN